MVKLYFREKYSKEISRLLKENNESIPLTYLHELEFMNALAQKQFRKEITKAEREHVIQSVQSHENKGVYYRPLMDWPEIVGFAIALSQRYTHKIGSRSLDILLVSMALSIKADAFLTFDEKQAELASRTRLNVINIG
jgi:predicted nucleic acid-binding protein